MREYRYSHDSATIREYSMSMRGYIPQSKCVYAKSQSPSWPNLLQMSVRAFLITFVHFPMLFVSLSLLTLLFIVRVCVVLTTNTINFRLEFSTLLD